jgi:hypothetical protein
MFLETSSVLRKKGSGRPTKRTAENIEEVEPKKLTYHLVQFSLSLKKVCTFFPIVRKIKALDNETPTA